MHRPGRNVPVVIHVCVLGVNLRVVHSVACTSNCMCVRHITHIGASLLCIRFQSVLVGFLGFEAGRGQRKKIGGTVIIGRSLCLDIVRSFQMAIAAQ